MLQCVPKYFTWYMRSRITLSCTCIISDLNDMVEGWNNRTNRTTTGHQSVLKKRQLQWLIEAHHIAVNPLLYVQPIANRAAQHLEIISKTFPTNQNSAHEIYD